jgi:hypothetical protein
MNMIGHQTTLQNLAPFLPNQGMKYFAQVTSYLPKRGFSPLLPKTPRGIYNPILKEISFDNPENSLP